MSRDVASQPKEWLKICDYLEKHKPDCALANRVLREVPAVYSIWDDKRRITLYPESKLLQGHLVKILNTLQNVANCCLETDKIPDIVVSDMLGQLDMIEKCAPVNDSVSHPQHYCQGGIECIEAIKASMTTIEFQGYLKGNCLKYLWRWRDKGGKEDLKKARVYLDWLIKTCEVEDA